VSNITVQEVHKSTFLFKSLGHKIYQFHSVTEDEVLKLHFYWWTTHGFIGNDYTATNLNL